MAGEALVHEGRLAVDRGARRGDEEAGEDRHEADVTCGESFQKMVCRMNCGTRLCGRGSCEIRADGGGCLIVGGWIEQSRKWNGYS